MNAWRKAIDRGSPCWDDFEGLLDSMDSSQFPSNVDLNQLLLPGTCNRNSQPIRFVDSESIPHIDYEEHIHTTGEVSTRSDNWHDLFNALIWARFPLLKSAMNAMHLAGMAESDGTGRGKQRDALTLFDECGVVLVSEQHPDLAYAAHRDWSMLFTGSAGQWLERFRVFVVGHAMLEKFLQPYKAMTAKALLVHVPEGFFDAGRGNQRALIDARLSEKLLSGHLLSSPSNLSPLPLMGIPGWWSASAQNDEFYADRQVFRPPSAGLQAAPVFSID